MGSPSIQSPSDWARFVYPSIPSECGQVVCSLWNRQTRESQHLAVPHDLSSSQRFDQTVSDLVAQGKDVYFGVGLRRPMLTKAQRGKVADVRGLPGFWLDIDLDRDPADGSPKITEPHKAKNLPKTEAQACEILSVLPAPTAIVDSGFGWHVYWLFDAVHPVAYHEEPGLTRASQLFQTRAIQHAQALGYHIDSNIWNLDRILRVPFTRNTKAGGSEPVQILFADGPRYGSVNTLLDSAGIDTRVLVSESTLAASRPDLSPENIPQELLEPRIQEAERQTPAWVKEALAGLQNPASKELMAKILAGESFAEPGNRDTTLQRVASIVAYLAPDRSPQELATEVLGPSLATFSDVDSGQFTQADRIEWAADKIARAQADARLDRVRTERQNASILDGLTRTARAAPRRDQRLGPAPHGPYSDTEIGKFAAQQNTTVSGFQRRWIIQKGQSYYVYINGDYQIPLSAMELDVSLPRDLAPAVSNGFIQLDTTNAKGEPRKKNTKELLADYASVARTVVTQLDLGYSYYDEETQTFYEACCPIRPLEPVYSPEVDRWLKLLGGAMSDKLLDWVATVTQLTKQSAALYIQGTPGTGKSMLSQGLAKLWHKGGPTELVRVLGEWSGDMARCPLIVADEQIPQSFKGQRTSAELRSLIGSSSRTLSRKYLANSDLVGATRLILSANNADMLVFDETLSQHDLEAVAGRFLHIKTDNKAKTYLESISTEGWVDDDIIAKHALWLRDNRAVLPGRRFIVEGEASDVSKMLATRGGVAGRVAEWLVRCICDDRPTAGPTQKDLVRIGNGDYLVCTDAIITFWDYYVKSSHVPSTPQVGAALRNLSTDTRRPKGKNRYYLIDLESICSWAESNLVGDPETIREKALAPCTTHTLIAPTSATAANAAQQVP